MSSSIWLDSEITSCVSPGPLKLNRQLTVQSIEFVHGLPSYWPIPREKCAYVVDISKLPISESKDDNGNLCSIDARIKDKVSQYFV